MSTFAFIHGAGDVGWSWHLVAVHLARHGHEIVAPDLPDEAASLEECADIVVDAIYYRHRLLPQLFTGFASSFEALRYA